MKVTCVYVFGKEHLAKFIQDSHGRSLGLIEIPVSFTFPCPEPHNADQARRTIELTRNAIEKMVEELNKTL